MARNNAADILREIEAQVRESAEVDAGLNEFMQNEVVPYAKSQYPVDDGSTASQVKVTKKARRGKGQVGNKSPLAHILEYGTKPDAEGGRRRVMIDGQWVTLDKDTPTPEFAPMAKTAKRFGGDMQGGISDDSDA